MRISKIHLAGLVAALAGGAAQNAAADDLTITTATTDPVFTATASGGTPGDVAVNAGGSITIDAGETAITINSSNADADAEFVTVGGSLRSAGADNTIGILLGNGQTGNISVTGSITLAEEYTPDDLDNDGDADEPFAAGSGRFGIYQAAGNTYTGNLDINGQTGIEGNNSGGIALLGTLNGNLTTGGSITVFGDNSHGVVIGTGGVTGDALLRGGVSTQGAGSIGIDVRGAIGGELRINGNITTTGFRFSSRPVQVGNLDADDLLIGGSGVAIRRSVADGVTIEGIGVADDPDDDGDGLTEEGNNDTNDDLAASIRSIGSAPALLIDAAAGVNLVLGPITGINAPGVGYGLRNAGAIASSGTYDGIQATGVRLDAIQGSSTLNLGTGFANEGQVAATAFEANSYALYVGDAVSMPTLLNSGTISASNAAETGAFTAYGLFIQDDAVTDTIQNSGSIRSTFAGENGDAVAIFDQSGTIDTINNTAFINAVIGRSAGGLDPLGDAIAIDLHLAGQGVTINQTANADTEVNEIIQGDILLGNFGDLINLQAGTIAGDIDFGGGADQFILNGGSQFLGRITDNGTLDLDVFDATLRMEEGSNLQAATVDFSADATFIPVLSGDASDPALIVANFVTFAGTAANHASILPALPSGLLEETQTFLTATGGMTGGALVEGIVTGENVPFVYNVEISRVNQLAADGAPNSLQASFTLKSPTQLGMTANEGAAFLPIIAALQQDDDASGALTSLDSAVEFFDAYEDLMPSYSSAATELAATAIQQMQSATANRLAATRLHDLRDTSVWAQEIGYGVTRTPPSSNGQEYTGGGFGIATGIDGPLDNGALFGLSASFVASEVEEDGRPEGEIAMSIGQLNAYLGTAMGPLDIDAIVGVGVGKLSSQRTVEIGAAFTSLSEADWWAYEGHAALRVSAPMAVSEWLIMSPQAALTYAYMQEESYEEEGGGAAIDYEADATNSQRLWADAGVEFSGRLAMGGQTVLAPRLFVGYRANLIDDGAERTFRFVSGTDEFTLTDEGNGDGAPLIGIGIDATNGYSTFTLGYEGEFGDQIERHSLNASVRFRF